MLYSSTNHISPSVSAKTAAICSFAPDGGLLMPERIPTLPEAFFRNFSEMSLKEIAYVISTTFFGGDVPAHVLKDIVDKTLNFPVKVKRISNNIFVAELFHGPTLSCKDFGSRFMARFLRAIIPTDKTINIIVSTSGNTGSAVANGFSGIKGVNVFVLYPKGKLTRVQQNEFSTLASNVHAIEVQGSIEDCKDLQHQLLKSPEIFGNQLVISANSLNICRIIPQIFYQFYAVARVIQQFEAENITKPRIAASIPCGNLGNAVAALISTRMGLPLSNVIAATNSNDTIYRYLLTGHLSPRKAEPSVAYALESGASPYNIPRINHLCDGDITSLNSLLEAYSCDDADICSTINRVLEDYNYTIDPHTAVAWNALEKHLAENPDTTGLVFATAHPAKSLDAMTAITGRPTELPLQLTRFMGGQRKIIKIPPTTTAFARFLNAITSNQNK